MNRNFHNKSIRICVGLFIAFQFTFIATPYSYADTGGYPYANGPTCATKCTPDPWRFFQRECTSFVAWKLNTTNSFAFKNDFDGNGTLDFRSATDWGAAARKFGYRVNMTPSVGSVAWWSSGHVAWVEMVNGEQVTIQEYNYGSKGTYYRRVIARNSVSGYIHFKDIVGGPNSSFSDGTYVLASDTGRVYVIAGGAAMYVSSWGAVGGEHTINVALSQSQIDTMSPYPINGTAVVDTTGTVSIIAGGAAMPVTSFANIPPLSSLTRVDSWAINNQLRQYPLDGTTVVDTTGTVFVIAGGAAMPVTSFANIPAVTSLPNVDSWAISNKLRQYPVNGTAIRDYSTGSIYIVAGGAPLPVTSLDNVPTITWTEVDGYAISNKLSKYPSSGTYVKGYRSGQTFQVLGTTTILSGANPSSVTVDDYAIDNVLRAVR